MNKLFGGLFINYILERGGGEWIAEWHVSPLPIRYKQKLSPCIPEAVAHNSNVLCLFHTYMND